jgi:hypothetical protein
MTSGDKIAKQQSAHRRWASAVRGGFFNRELGRRVGFQALIRDGCSASHRAPIRACGQTLFSPVDGLQPGLEAGCYGIVSALGGEQLGWIAPIRVGVTVFLSPVVALVRVQAGDESLDPAAFGFEQRAGAVVIHGNLPDRPDVLTEPSCPAWVFRVITAGRSTGSAERMAPLAPAADRLPSGS